MQKKWLTLLFLMSECTSNLKWQLITSLHLVLMASFSFAWLIFLVVGMMDLLYCKYIAAYLQEHQNLQDYTQIRVSKKNKQRNLLQTWDCIFPTGKQWYLFKVNIQGARSNFQDNAWRHKKVIQSTELAGLNQISTTLMLSYRGWHCYPS